MIYNKNKPNKAINFLADFLGFLYFATMLYFISGGSGNFFGFLLILIIIICFLYLLNEKEKKNIQQGLGKKFNERDWLGRQ